MFLKLENFPSKSLFNFTNSRLVFHQHLVFFPKLKVNTKTCLKNGLDIIGYIVWSNEDF